jgi:hypothetical protein
LAIAPTQHLNIRANTSPAKVGSVIMVLSAAQTHNQTENNAPYSLFGDNSGIYGSWLLHSQRNSLLKYQWHWDGGHFAHHKFHRDQPNANTHANDYADSHFNAITNEDSDTDANGNCFSHGNTDGNANADSHADANTNRHPNAQTDSNPDTNCHCNADAYTFADTNRHSNSDSDTDTDTNARRSIR